MTYQQIKEIIRKTLFIFIISIVFFILLKNWFIVVCLLLFVLLLIYYYCQIDKIKETTLCLIVQNNKVLMMLRNKKKNDVHLNKYNGLGGSVEKGESKEECVLREVYEEAGIRLTNYYYVGKVEFKNFGFKIGKEIMYCFVGYEFENDIGYCNEGELEWVDIDKVMNLPLWEGDQYFLMNIVLNQPFKAYLHYENDKVVQHKIYKR